MGDPEEKGVGCRGVWGWFEGAVCCDSAGASLFVPSSARPVLPTKGKCSVNQHCYISKCSSLQHLHTPRATPRRPPRVRGGRGGEISTTLLFFVFPI